jgi:hypothetical protein
MKLLMLTRTLAALLATMTLFAADSPFAGTWKQNRAKDKEESLFNIKETAKDRYQIEEGTIKFDLVADGMSRPGPLGGNIVFTQVDASTWSGSVDTKNHPKIRYHLKDENTLEIENEQNDASGQVYKSNYVYVRTDASSGLGGAWKLRKTGTTIGPENVMVIKNANHGLAFDYPSFKVDLVMTLDGKEYPVHGAMYTDQMKFGGKAKLVDNNTIEEVRMLNGQETGKMQYKLSPDKKTLTLTNDSPEEHSTTVYERQ